MPYASSIQVVNDPNGTAYAFLADDGALWQCQWNPEAQRWDKAQIVPQAFGGTQLHALVLDNLWAATNQPGIVLAYRLGEGSGAEIYASLGQWGGDGELNWTAPIALTDDQVEDQAFALVAEEGNAGFSLVVQKQQANTPLVALLEQLSTLPQDQRQSALEAGLSKERADSDLYVSQFTIGTAGTSDTTNPEAPTLRNLTAGGTATTLTFSPSQPTTASPPLPFSGHTLLSRQQLSVAPAPSPQSTATPTMQSVASTASTSEGGVNWQGGTSGQNDGTTQDNSASLRYGFLFGQNLLRWELEHGAHGATKSPPLAEDSLSDAVSNAATEAGSEAGGDLGEEVEPELDASTISGDIQFINRASGSLEEILNPPPSELANDLLGGESLIRRNSDAVSIIASDGSEADDSGSDGSGASSEDEDSNLGYSWTGSAENPVNNGLFYKGSLGLFSTGRGGPTVQSSASLFYERGNVQRQGLFKDARAKSLDKEGELLGWTKLSSGNSLGGGGELETIYQYQGKGKPNLISLTSEESIGLDYEHTSLRFSEEGGSLLFDAAISTGWMFEQRLISDPGDFLPSWLAYLGYIGGGLANLEKWLQGARYLGLQTGFNNEERAEQGVSNLAEQASDRDSAFLRGLNIANAVAGTILAAAGPATAIAAAASDAGLLANAQFDHSSGLQFSTQLTGRYLWKSILGIQLMAANKLSKYLFGADANSASDNILINAGLALPLGAAIPLVSYTNTWTWGPQPDQEQTAPTARLSSATSTSATATDQSVAISSTTTAASQGSAYYSAASGDAYPFQFAPQVGSNSDDATSPATATTTAVPLTESATPLQLFTLQTTALGDINPTGSGDSAGLTLLNAGSNLNDGNYSNVPILGVSTTGSFGGSSAAQASFTVLNGSLVASSFQITSSGSYLALPETQPGSGLYGLVLDVFSSGIATPPDPSSNNPGTPYKDLPLITVAASRTNPPLLSQPVQRINSVVVDASNQADDVVYPRYDPSTQQVTPVSSNDNGIYIYSDIPVQLFSQVSATTSDTTNQAIETAAVSLLNPGAVTSTIYLSNGVIQAVQLNQPLLLAPDANALSYTLQLTLPAAVVNSLPGTPAPTFTVTPQSLSLNNMVADEQFSAQPGVATSGVYLAAGLIDEIGISAAMAAWPAQNRVTYVTTNTGSSDSEVNIVYLNGNEIIAGDIVPQGSLEPSNLTLADLYQNDYSFSAASTPTAIDIAGTGGFSGNTLVAWVEASEPVIPITDPDDGAANFQNFMEALYGKQRINYRLNRGQSRGWVAPSLATLYGPTDAIINHLQAFNVPNPNESGSNSTMLVWTETSIAAIKGIPPQAISFQGWIEGNTLTVTSLSGTLQIGDLLSGNGVAEATVITGIASAFDPSSGSGTYTISSAQTLATPSNPATLKATPLLPPTIIKAGFINPNATSLQWDDLFTDATGNSTIQTIPWDPTNLVGLSIHDISIASQPLLQADGSLISSPLISWSQAVLPPYEQRVLSDQPSLYLQFNQLESGVNAINIGSVDSVYTTTSASETGLNFTIAGALPAYQTTAVQNSDGTGVLNTGLGSSYSTIRQIGRSIPTGDNATGSQAITALSGSIEGTTLTVSALAAGSLAVGDVLTGPGVLPGTTITNLAAVNAATGLGTYTINQSQTLATTDLEAIAAPARLPLCSFGGSISGTTLTVTGISQGNLAVGDFISGPGISPGTMIVAVETSAGSTGTYTLNRSQSVPASSLIAVPGTPTLPYTIEFWAQLQPLSNPQGAGLVALGQPSDAAVAAPSLPEGWLLNASFLVDRLTYGQAAAQGLIATIPTGVARSSLYGWQWGVLATGANTTAMDGNGGSNLYNNALLLSNLNSGANLDGVSQFLANYNLLPQDLTGLDGSDAATIANVPGTQLQFSNTINPITNLPDSNLNGIGVDSSTALLNQGLVTVSDGLSTELAAMFQALWDYQLNTGEAKVNFSLAPDSNNGTTSSDGQLPSAFSNENYAGYPLEFSLTSGVAVSVNGAGQLVFDIGPNTSLVSASTESLSEDLRDGKWHYIVASYLPTYQTYEASGTLIQVPTNRGIASLYVDSQLVASDSEVFNPYPLINLNDSALLLANNAGGAIDQLAIYDKALTSADPSPNNSGQWPAPTPDDALAILADFGYSIATKTPDPGTIPGAINAHWAVRNVNPNAAVLATFTSSFEASSGTWSQASKLNPILQLDPTSPSYSGAGAIQDALVITIPSSNWGMAAAGPWSITTEDGTQSSSSFNPANQLLKGIAVTITNSSEPNQEPQTIQLGPEQVLIGNQTLQSLQPLASESNFNYTILSAAPAFTLLIRRDQLPASSQPLQDEYGTIYSFNFIDIGSSESSSSTVSNTNAVFINAAGSNLANILETGDITSADLSQQQQRNSAIATAEVIEQAPLQLKYIDSGVVFKSALSTAAANNPTTATPANSFGQSQVFGQFIDSAGHRNGWLAIAQPFSSNALSDPAGRVWIQYTGQSINGIPSSEPSQAPSTWLNALANSNFSPETANLPLLGDANTPSSSGGLLIQADPTSGWGQNFGQTMLVADVNNDGVEDLIIAAPQANGGGRVVIIDGVWIQNNLNNGESSTPLNLANPNNQGNHVTMLVAAEPTSNNDDISVANFGAALAFDSSTQTLWIGAPNYLRQLDPNNATPLSSLQPIGAVYRYSSNAANPNGWGSGLATSLSTTILGSGGTTDSLDPTGATTTTYWGSQLGTAIAVNGSGGMAISAPGVEASLLYSGSEAVQQAAAGQKRPSDPYGDGALVKIQLPSANTNNTVSSVQGLSNADLQDVVSPSSQSKNSLSQEESTYMQTLKELQTQTIVEATYNNNQAIQTGSVGAVYLFNSSEDLSSLSEPISAETVLTASQGGATFYGPNPWNTLGASGFGSSLSFADLTNTNSASSLAIGASQAGGSGAVYVVDTNQPFTSATQPSWLGAINLGSNQYLAYLASDLTLYGAAAADSFGSGLLNLGDVNNDGYQDLLIQAYNASSGAGNGYVLFGSDQLSAASSSAASPNPASGNVAPTSIGMVQRADGSSLNLSILSELGAGTVGYTGQGSFGAGDVNGDGFNDIQLGSGPNGEAYLTWGHSYLEAINNLQLSKLASDTGYLLPGLASTQQGSLRSIGDFNGDGYDDSITIEPGTALANVRLELGGNTQEILADYAYSDYSFTIVNGTEVQAAGDINGDGYSDIALFLDQNLSTAAEGNQGAGSTTGLLFGRPSGDLPYGSGFGLLAPVDPNSSAPLAPLPGLDVAGGSSEVAPSMIAVGNTLYAAASSGSLIWFSQSSDGGNNWDPWTNISANNSAFASSASPSLAFFNNKLYLAFLNPSGTLSLASWDPASNNPAAWTNPSVLNQSSLASEAFESRYSPQLMARGDALAVIWVDSSQGQITASYSTTPDSIPTPWSPIDGGSSTATPALARDGDMLYMAVQGNSSNANAIAWTSSSDGGATWADWQSLPSTMTSDQAPSLAVIDGTLYLSFLSPDSNAITITSLSDAASNDWTLQYQIPGQSAAYASITSETIAGTEQLAIYYVANDGTGRILKAYSASPTSSAEWQSDLEIAYDNGAAPQTASGPLAVSQYNGQTYLAYQGGTTTDPADTIYVTTSSNSNESSDWWAQEIVDPNITTGLGLTNNTNGLILSYSDASQANALQLSLLQPQDNNRLLVQPSSSQDLPTTLSNAITILSTSDADGFILAGINTAANASLVQTRLIPSIANWAAPTPLLQRLESNGTVSFAPINATAAPTAAFLGSAPVIAVNNNGGINVYAGVENSLALELTSSFTTASDGPAISSAPVLSSTPTGLALTYTTTDGAITLNRLDVVSANGTPVDGVQITAAGGVDTSTADLQWQSITLNAATSGVSTNLASVPVSVNGMLLLANVRNSASQANQIWLNAVPNRSDPESLTWLNSTIQLSDGNGGWSINQPTGITVATPWQSLADGTAYQPPVFAEDNGVLYAAVQGDDPYLYWTSSSNGGQNWAAWQQLPAAMSTDQTPAVAVVNGTLYLAYLGNDNPEINITALTDAATNSWSNQYQIPNQSAQSISLINENGDLALYYLGTNNDLYRTASSNPGASNSWSSITKILDDNGAASQTAAGQLATTSLAGTTYLAYQGGTPESPNATIYLTASNSPSNGSSWSLIDNLPQANSRSNSGVGLTTQGDALILSYADVINGSSVLQLQRGTVSDETWMSSLETTLPSPGETPTPTASLFGSNNSDLLVAAINGNSDRAITTTFVSQEPLSAEQSSSSLTSAGDLNNDGYDDLLVTANSVVAYGNATPQVYTGLRLISGAATSDQLSSNNSSASSSQLVQLAPAFVASTATPITSLSGRDPSNNLLNLTIASGTGSPLSFLQAGVTPEALMSPSNSVASASALLGSSQLNDAQSLTSPSVSSPGDWGQANLNSNASYGDLNGDGWRDYLNPAGNLAIDTVPELSYSLWSIRAAGDVNGNGVDDVLLSLSPSPTGPAYGQVVAGQPSALETVLVDGSLFEVNTTTNSFRLDRLREPLNPYSQPELYDLGSTSADAYVPELQNWFEPILPFQPGQLIGASAANVVAVDAARSFSPPSAAVNAQGQVYLVFSGADTSGSDGASGLWMAYQSGDGSWTQIDLPVGDNANLLSPSAVFYEGGLYIAYVNTDKDLYIAACADISNDLTSASSWSNYQVITTADESSAISPTLLAEPGRLALYFPANTNTSNNSLSTPQENIRYLFSRNPEVGNSWGSSYDQASDGYTGLSGTLSAAPAPGAAAAPLITTSPVAATLFQGRTVLAFRSTAANLETANLILATQVASSPTESEPSPTLSWMSFDTGIDAISGVSLVSDQALLYLASAYNNDPNSNTQPTPVFWSARPDGDGQWSMGDQQSVDGLNFLSDALYSTWTPYFANGTLSGAWSNNQSNLYAATIDVNVEAPIQPSLAGYSIDGDLDINGDGFADVLISDPSDPAIGVNNQYSLFGGDYLGIASQVGTPGADTLVGTPVADVIYSLGGSDVVQSNGGADVIYSGSGDDQIAINGNTFFRIAAGSGFDQLRLAGMADQAYDFQLNVASPQYFAGSKLQDIELISSLDYGANTLSFDAAAVNAINPDRILFLTPDLSDSIILSDEFQRNSAFDTNFTGSLWNAYTAADQGTPGTANPALIYVLNPAGASASDWLNQQVSITGGLTAQPMALRLAAPAFAEAPLAAGASLEATPMLFRAMEATAAAPPKREASLAIPPGEAPAQLALDDTPERSAVSATPSLPLPSEVISSTAFGAGLVLEALRTEASAGIARFRLRRTDNRRDQLVAYSSSSANSNSDPGRHYDAVLGLVRLEAGESSKLITVPLKAEQIAGLRRPTFSLKVEEIPDRGQSGFDLLLRPDADANGAHPALSALALNFNRNGHKGSIQLRADTTTNDAAAKQELRLTLIHRASSEALPQERDGRFQTLLLRDGAHTAFDLDGIRNAQIQTELLLKLKEDRSGISLKQAHSSGSNLPLSLLHQPRFSSAADRTLLIADPNNGAPARLRLQGTVRRLAPETMQIGYVRLRPGEEAADLLADLSSFQSRSQTLFTTLQNTTRNVLPESLPSFSRAFPASNQNRLLFFAVQATNLETLSDLNDERFTVLEAEPVGQRDQRALFRAENGMAFHLDVVNNSMEPDGLIAARQGEAPVLDASRFSARQSLSGTVALAREASADSLISFYRCLDAQGTVLGRGNTPVYPGDDNYAQAALRAKNQLSTLTDLTVANGSSRTHPFSISGGSFLAPTALVEHGKRQIRYFAFPEANPDGIQHFRILATNTIGFEDQRRGGDLDFNDSISQIHFSGVF